MSRNGIKTIFFSMFFLILSSSAVQAKKNVIEDGKKVKFDYTLKVDGEILETTKNKFPLRYVHGVNPFVKGLYDQLEGMKKRQKKTIVVLPEDGYGAVNEKAFQEVTKSSFPTSFVLKKGNPIDLNSPDGKTVRGYIREIRENTVLIDFNHPLAGKTLIFDVKILDIE